MVRCAFMWNESVHSNFSFLYASNDKKINQYSDACISEITEFIPVPVRYFWTYRIVLNRRSSVRPTVTRDPSCVCVLCCLCCLQCIRELCVCVRDKHVYPEITVVTQIICRIRRQTPVNAEYDIRVAAAYRGILSRFDYTKPPHNTQTHTHNSARSQRQNQQLRYVINTYVEMLSACTVITIAMH